MMYSDQEFPISLNSTFYCHHYKLRSMTVIRVAPTLHDTTVLSPTYYPKHHIAHWVSSVENVCTFVHEP